MVEAIGAVQSQQWAAPPVALWTRMRAFVPDDLYAALQDGTLVSGILLRGTLHLVSAREHPAYATVAAPDAADPGLADLRAAVAKHAAAEPRTGEQIAAAAEQWVQQHPDALDADALEHQRGRSWRPLVRWPGLIRVPAAGTPWGARTPAGYRSAPHPPEEDAEAALAEVVRRHLRAFGPAAPEDVAAWTGQRVPPVRAAFAALAGELVELRGDDGRVLHDLPDAPRPDAEVPAPPRFLPAFDSTLLAYATKRRGRILPDAVRDLVYLRANLQIRPTFLVDGRVAGIWSVEVKRREALVTLTPGGRLGRAHRAALVEEGERLGRFVAPEARGVRVVVGRG